MHRGRVWVCEVVNYRHRNGERPEGDRILILEDTDGDGRADKSTVFYQGRDIDSAMGICVLGNRVIVSCSPNIFVFTDTDGDGKADKKEVLFTQNGNPAARPHGPQVRLRPRRAAVLELRQRGALGSRSRRQDVVKDIFGRPVVDEGQPFYGGMAFRCEPDGSKFEVLAHNFRNNYELAVDSFGGLWQSDNDDDGNRGRPHQLSARVRQLRLPRRDDRRELADAAHQSRSHDPRTALAPKRSGRRSQPAGHRSRLADGHRRLRGDAAAETVPRTGDSLPTRARTWCGPTRSCRTEPDTARRGPSTCCRGPAITGFARRTSASRPTVR